MSRRDAAWLAEAVPERRFGIKGPRAAAALAELQLAVPGVANAWAPLRDTDGEGGWNVIGRLGASEFFIEERAPATGILAVQALLAGGYPGVYPVLREDAAFMLGGGSADDVLAQVCNVNFRALPFEARPVLMTLMIGVSVLVLPQVSDDDGRVFRIWCDPSFGTYLRAELEEIVTGISSGSAQ